MTGASFIQLDSDHDTGTTSLADTPISGPKWIKLPALTVGFVGLQALWSVEMSYGTLPASSNPYAIFTRTTSASPYLLSLGLSKSLMAIVFLAGPLSGLIVQPIVGTVGSLAVRPPHTQIVQRRGSCRQLEVEVWKAAAIYDRWCHYNRSGHRPVRFHPPRCGYILRGGIRASTYLRCAYKEEQYAHRAFSTGPCQYGSPCSPSTSWTSR